MIIGREYHFDAAHYLPGMPEGHKCARMHGHTYIIKVFVHGGPDKTTGMVIDHDFIDTAWKQTCFNLVDHRVLNEVVGLEVPTYENLAMWIWGQMETTAAMTGKLCEVYVQEGLKSHCKYLGHGRKKAT